MTPMRLLIPKTPEKAIGFYEPYKKDSLGLISSIVVLDTENGRMFVRAMQTADSNIQKLKMLMKFTHPSDSTDEISRTVFEQKRHTMVMIVTRRYLLGIMDMVQTLRNHFYTTYGQDFMEETFTPVGLNFMKFDDDTLVSGFLKSVQATNANMTQTISEFEFRYTEPCTLCMLDHYGKTR